MVIFGIIAFIMEENDFPVAPAILGLVLGSLLEQSFMISMIKSEWNLLAFFSRPLTAILGAVTIGIWLSPIITMLVKRRKPEHIKPSAN